MSVGMKVHKVFMRRGIIEGEETIVGIWEKGEFNSVSLNLLLLLMSKLGVNKSCKKNCKRLLDQKTCDCD